VKTLREFSVRNVKRPKKKAGGSGLGEFQSEKSAQEPSPKNRLIRINSTFQEFSLRKNLAGE
jgi:hypothetical protein